MPSCMVQKCSNRTRRYKTSKKPGEEEKSKITFHKFPRDPTKREAWLKNLQIPNFKVKNYHSICSEHFLESSFDKTSLSCVRLKDHALPHVRICSDLRDSQANSQEAGTSTAADAGQATLSTETAANKDHVCESSSPSEYEEIRKTILLEGSTFVDGPFTVTERTYASRSTSMSPDRCSTRSRSRTTRSTSMSPRRDNETPCKIHLRKALDNSKQLYRHKIRMLQQKQRRSEKRIANLKSVLSSLQKTNIS